MNANTSDGFRCTRGVVSSIGAIVCEVALASCGGGSGSGGGGGGGIIGESLSLVWDPPAANFDGSGVNDIAGYRVYDGPSPGDYDMVTDVGVDPEVTLDGLDPGTYYIAVAAIDSAGNESSLSPEVVATLP